MPEPHPGVRWEHGCTPSCGQVQVGTPRAAAAGLDRRACYRRWARKECVCTSIDVADGGRKGIPIRAQRSQVCWCRGDLAVERKDSAVSAAGSLLQSHVCSSCMAPRSTCRLNSEPKPLRTRKPSANGSLMVLQLHWRTTSQQSHACALEARQESRSLACSAHGALLGRAAKAIWCVGPWHHPRDGADVEVGLGRARLCNGKMRRLVDCVPLQCFCRVGFFSPFVTKVSRANSNFHSEIPYLHDYLRSSTATVGKHRSNQVSFRSSTNLLVSGAFIGRGPATTANDWVCLQTQLYAAAGRLPVGGL